MRFRVEFGDALAIEISKAYKIVDKTDEALSLFILELRQATPMKDGCAVRRYLATGHYEYVTDKIIKRN